MPTLEELDRKVDVAFWGKWGQAPAGPMVARPDGENLCYRCIEALGSRGAGASVRADDDIWVHYHEPCWYEAVDEWQARDAVEHGLDASLESEDIDKW